MLLVLLYKKQSSSSADSLFARVWASTLMTSLTSKGPEVNFIDGMLWRLEKGF